jgi:ketosteroid isomerase-like protein
MPIRMGGIRLPRRIASAGTLALSLLIVGCAQPRSTPVPPAHDPKQDEVHIRAAAARIWAGVAGNDAAAALAEYSEDAMLLGTGMATVRGKSAITEQLTDLFKAVSFREAVGTVTDIMVSGDLGVETGTYSWTIVPASGVATSDVGKYVHVWKRQGDGAWKVVRYVVNSDKPAP